MLIFNNLFDITGINWCNTESIQVFFSWLVAENKSMTTVNIKYHTLIFFLCLVQALDINIETSLNI